jgi:hypothetical protein
MDQNSFTKFSYKPKDVVRILRSFGIANLQKNSNTAEIIIIIFDQYFMAGAE